MRVCVASRTLDADSISSMCLKLGGRNIKVAPRSKQVFVDMDEDKIDELDENDNLFISPMYVKKMVQDFNIEPHDVDEMTYVEPQATYQSSLAKCWTKFDVFSSSFSPELTGNGCVVAVLDTGIRKTHRSLVGKVVYELDMTSPNPLDGNPDDVYGHGTSVAYLIAGGRSAYAEESGMAPGVKLWNVKVLDNNGEGTSENVVMGIEAIHDAYISAIEDGLQYGDPAFPNIINMSIGQDDELDDSDPVKIAIDNFMEDAPGFTIVCAAGNGGAEVLSPASHEKVWSVGVSLFVPWQLLALSARGSVSGIQKPEFVNYGVNIVCASNENNDAYTVKSGTSFAAPLLCGQLALLREALITSGEISQWDSLTQEEQEQIFGRICVVPQGISQSDLLGWGYGMPMGDALLELFSTQSSGVESLMYALPVISMISMIGSSA